MSSPQSRTIHGDRSPSPASSTLSYSYASSISDRHLVEDILYEAFEHPASQHFPLLPPSLAPVFPSRRPPNPSSYLLNPGEQTSALMSIQELRRQLEAQQPKIKSLYFRALGLSPPLRTTGLEEGKEESTPRLSAALQNYFHKHSLPLSEVAPSQHVRLDWYPEEMDGVIVFLQDSIDRRNEMIGFLEELEAGAWEEMQYLWPSDQEIEEMRVGGETEEGLRSKGVTGRGVLRPCRKHGYVHGWSGVRDEVVLRGEVCVLDARRKRRAARRKGLDLQDVRDAVEDVEGGTWEGNGKGRA